MNINKNALRKWLKYSIVIASVLFIASLLIYSHIHKSAKPHIYQSAEMLPQKQVALVLGARVYSNGSLSRMMQDRADQGIALYKSGKVEKILVSGDHGTKQYDEVNTIRNYMIKQGIPAEDIFMDHAGFDTYSSMYRARDVFKVKSLIVVTQEFHLPRAIFLAQQLGLDACGLVADAQQYTARSRRFSAVREVPACVKAFLEGSIFQPEPHFLGEAIPISGDGRLTEDK
ncbi:MAG: SanA/YdcF family protein [Bacteroidia bacterium]